jgi:xanthine/CO dehydrogenase XdhC/CoxF family maturation factor
VNKDARDVLAAASRGGALTLATVVRVRGSSYRKPGARMLIADGVAVAGSVSGGCLEREIARRGAWWAADGPVVRTFTSERDPGDDERSATGCGGTVDVLIENDVETALAALRWVAAQRAAACLVTELPSGRRAAAAGGAMHLSAPEKVHSTIWGDPALLGRDDVFREDIPAPRELLVAGRHHDVAPLVRIGRLLGWEVTVAATGVASRALGDPDGRIPLDAETVAAWAQARPGAAIVIMTHSLALDREILDGLDGAAPAYLGVLGPRHRIGEVGDHVRSPVGLDLGGDGPEAIALSIASDVQATWHGRDAGRLSAVRTVPRLVSVG